jgi:hypothetical protein
MTESKEMVYLCEVLVFEAAGGNLGDCGTGRLRLLSRHVLKVVRASREARGLKQKALCGEFGPVQSRASREARGLKRRRR